VSPAAAAPRIGDCGTADAPAAYSSGACDLNGSSQVCTYSNGTVVCDPSACEAGVQEYAVKYGASNEISVFGGCDVKGVTELYCCLIEDTSAEILNLELFGTSFTDEKIAFTYDTGSGIKNLSPTSGKLTAAAFGREGNDAIWGSWYDDVSYVENLHGDDGIDGIHGNDGNDNLFGGDGDDTLVGGSGDDVLRGEKNRDTLDGGPGNDRLYGNNHRDTLTGGTGEDTLYGGNARDILSGGPDRDILYGGNGNDDLFGEGGPDDLFGENGDDTLDGGGEFDRVHGGYGDDTLSGGDDADWLYGGYGQDEMNGGDGDDVLCDFHELEETTCSVSNTYNGDDGVDRAFMANGIGAGYQYCPTMLQLGSSINEASQALRDWRGVIATFGSWSLTTPPERRPDGPRSHPTSRSRG